MQRGRWVCFGPDLICVYVRRNTEEFKAAIVPCWKIKPTKEVQSENTILRIDFSPSNNTRPFIKIDTRAESEHTGNVNRRVRVRRYRKRISDRTLRRGWPLPVRIVALGCFRKSYFFLRYPRRFAATTYRTVAVNSSLPVRFRVIFFAYHIVYECT